MSITAKTSMSTLRGQRDIVMGQVVEAKRAGNAAGVAALTRTLANLEYAEATLFAARESGKSGLKAGVDAGFVPYGDR